MTVLVLALVAVASLSLSAGGGLWLVGAILRRIGQEVEAPGLLRGGRWIGVLERLAITGGILAGHPEAAAVVIAVKGLGRYPELRGGAGETASRASERFIVGTLASFLWAALVGVVGVMIAGALD
ncbi:hypothetical protein LGT39_14615 [Demequina sp. TTPB684]|uniref:hypothetical protein n=1 Tax=unclassified Demequina TaxID=2620311 RepID=UPI001CF5E6BD|nr:MULTISPECIES: hypothetical protein [unclassified Demequina]MCB2414080.1 hypothetical protein [Demequina sp. TTPB684]UPU89209.1 hypothetical protein LGT36_004600 [Demequina sp. TMPB413]